ncbi:MAG: hypothetical protein ACREQ2_24070 [Candidatus Binatia bacterium]
MLASGWQNRASEVYFVLLGGAFKVGSSYTPEEWILRAIEHPVREEIQQDGRIRRWAQIDEMDGKYLRVILLPDQETIHNAFFDRTFKP